MYNTLYIRSAPTLRAPRYNRYPVVTDRSLKGILLPVQVNSVQTSFLSGTGSTLTQNAPQN